MPLLLTAVTKKEKEANMHDLKCCVRYGGKMYCWDEANERVVIVSIEDIEFSECPERVMKLIMRSLKEGKQEL